MGQDRIGRADRAIRCMSHTHVVKGAFRVIFNAGLIDDEALTLRRLTSGAADKTQADG